MSSPTPVALSVRDATAADAAACAALYAPYVRGTTISFEEEAPDAAEVARRIARAQERHAWIVAEEPGAGDSGGDGPRVVAYAYAGPFSGRAAYRWSCEVSVYAELGRRRSGVGRLLYGELFARLGRRGYRSLFAGVAEPNAASAGLHAAMGFERVGTYRRVGFKHGAWRDVTWWQRALGEDGPAGEPPAEPR
ncbi:GNAT family N-acetyltransferase [Kineococcus auxinigenes]|uniref:GNAT family N-acetyltransferase n=1 Tax=unclassified Kineococcus TaxID=2621656 RepID=UPI003D7DC303